MRKGGVTSSTRATEESITLDVNAKKVSYQLSLKSEYQDYNTYWTDPKKTPIGIPKKFMIEKYGGPYQACCPDGNAWFLPSLVSPTNTYGLGVIFEAKKEDIKGQQWERAYKNMKVGSKFNRDTDYVLFCTGKGAISDENSKTRKGLGKWYCFEKAVKVDWDEEGLLNTFVYFQLKSFTQQQYFEIMQFHLDKKLGIETPKINKIDSYTPPTLNEFI